MLTSSQILLFIWRNKPQMAAAQVHLVALILVGALIAFLSIPFWTNYVNTDFCRAQPWLLLLGLDFFLGPLLIKNFRVYSLFAAARKLKKQVIPVRPSLI